MLSACELASMRATVLSTLSERCVVVRSQVTPNAENFPEAADMSVVQPRDGGTTLPCRVWVKREQASQLIEGDKPQTRTRFDIQLPYDVDVQSKDRIVIADEVYVVTDSTGGASDESSVMARCDRVY